MTNIPPIIQYAIHPYAYSAFPECYSKPIEFIESLRSALNLISSENSLSIKQWGKYCIVSCAWRSADAIDLATFMVKEQSKRCVITQAWHSSNNINLATFMVKAWGKYCIVTCAWNLPDAIELATLITNNKHKGHKKS